VSATLAPPRRRLRTRVTLFFLLAASPAVVVSAGAVVVIDRLIAQEIRQRADETFAAVRLALDDEQRRVQGALQRAGRDESVRSLADAVEHDDALARAEPLAARVAAEAELGLFAIVAARGPEQDTLVSSAHLPAAVGDPAPRFAMVATATAARAGYAVDLVSGNPPSATPIIGAVQPVVDRRGRTALVLYGGSRLDVGLLERVARTRGVGLILDSPDGPTRRFAPPGPALDRPPTRSVTLPALGESGAPSARLGVVVDTRRLEHVRRRFAVLAALLAVGVLAGSLLAGAWLSRPITEPIVGLARAAAQVAQGDLSVRLPPSGDDEVGRLVEGFNHMVGELAEARVSLARAERVAAWRDAARQVAHEIKNPLTPMRMAMETLRKAWDRQHPELEPILKESTQAVLDEVQALSRIVSAFSEFARLPKPRPEAIAPLELLAATHRLYARAPAGVRVELDEAAVGAQDLPAVDADREQIGRVLINLVKNAVEALGEGGGEVRLDARAESRGGRAGVRLEVHDDGPGVPESDRARLFQPYFTTKREGTGLGLAIVERIVAEHGGAIDLDSAPGRTCFSVWLPVAGARPTDAPMGDDA
jgi:two-component system nitrogen regulation sensor histidine kinase NtrY